MKRYIILIFSLVLVLTFSGVAGTGQVIKVDRPDIQGFMGFVPDEIVVRFAPGVLKKMDKAQAPQGRLGIPDLDRLGARHGVLSIKPQFPGAKKKRYQGREVDLAGWHQVKFRGKVDVLTVVKAYKARPGVLEAQPIGIHTVSTCPNDPYFDEIIGPFGEVYDQWHLKKIQACEAFDLATGNEKIIVAIPDTGVRYFHQDLGGSFASYIPNEDPNQNPFDPATTTINGNVWFNELEKDGTPGVDDDGNDIYDDWVGWDFVSEETATYPPSPGEDGSVEDNDPRDFNGHGTHCAGIVAALTNNDWDIASIAGGWGDSSFAPEGNGVKIMPLRVGWSSLISYYYWFYIIEVGVVRMDYAAQAMVYAADHDARIVSCSWGSSDSGGLGAAVDYFLATTDKRPKGGLVFKAAGNDGNTDADYLCSRTDVVSVAATDQGDYKASFSNYGPWVDISAPGVKIWSLYHGNNEVWGLDPAVDYVTDMEGTSMACPLAAGVAALIWSKNPEWTAEQVKQRLLATADNIDALNPRYSGKLGAGRVNAYAAVQDDSPTQPNEPPIARFTFIPNGLTVNFDASVSTDPDGTITSYAWDFGDSSATGEGVRPWYTYAAGGTYSVTLTVTDNGGATDSITQAVEVSESAIDTMDVALADFSSSLNKKFWQAAVTITVSDAAGNPVPNASVYGNFVGVKRGEVTGVTDGDGQITFSKNISNDQSSVTFEVIVTHATLPDARGSIVLAPGP